MLNTHSAERTEYTDYGTQIDKIHQFFWGSLWVERPYSSVLQPSLSSSMTDGNQNGYVFYKPDQFMNAPLNCHNPNSKDLLNEQTVFGHYWILCFSRWRWKNQGPCHFLHPGQNM
jgi:hypothetical protein